MHPHIGNITQEVLLKQLKSIFPTETPQTNVRKQTKLKYAPERTHYLELDIWYPSLNLCFEFQDHHHYVTTWYSQQSSSTVRENDDIKRDIIRHAGIELITLPCWWNGSAESLMSTIQFHCPDLAKQVGPEVPLNPPLNFLKIYEILRVGELMCASFPSHSGIPEGHWWLGEKYDGIRFCWNQQRIYTRFGNELPVNRSIYSNISPIEIDGEIWFGRGSFHLALTVLNNSAVQWDLLRMIAFDFPTNANNLPFETRYKFLLRKINTDHPFLIVVSRFLIKNEIIPNIEKLIEYIVHNDGEGIILRKFGSPYVHGRSSLLLKLKSVFGDSEGLVVKAFHGSVQLQLPNGTTTNVPSSNVHVSKLRAGDVVTFSYEHYNHANHNIFVNLQINRIRKDLSWQNVLSSGGGQNGKDLMTNSRWTTHKMRHFLEFFAKSRHLDPLHRATWYTITRADILPLKKGKLILRKFMGYISAVKNLFPEFDFDDDLFIESWNTDAKRRHFFEKYAKNAGFDPLVPENWYSQSKEKLKETKGAAIVTSFHRGLVSRALFDLFPEIGLDISKLKPRSWENPSRRRKFFEKYAHAHGFDPLIAANWYLQSKSKIRSEKNAESLLQYHANNVAKALVDLFPDIGLDYAKLRNSTFGNVVKRRNVLVRFAEKNIFDPLNPENWYFQSGAKIYADEKIRKVLSHYSNSIVKALLALFPDIGLNRSKLRHLSPNETDKQRHFFVKYAQENHFDPLNPAKWYAQSRSKILAVKGITKALGDKPNIPQCLLRSFPHIDLSESKLDKAFKSNANHKRFKAYQLRVDVVN